MLKLFFFVIFVSSFENWAYGASPLLYPPHRGEERIKAFPLDGERLDRGESLLHMPPFSFSVGERKIMKHFVVSLSPHKTQKNLIYLSLALYPADDRHKKLYRASEDSA